MEDLIEISRTAYRYKGLLIFKESTEDTFEVVTSEKILLFRVKKWKISQHAQAGYFETINDACSHIDNNILITPSFDTKLKRRK